jgi:hypothetical protein
MNYETPLGTWCPTCQMVLGARCRTPDGIFLPVGEYHTLRKQRWERLLELTTPPRARTSENAARREG